MSEYTNFGWDEVNIELRHLIAQINKLRRRNAELEEERDRMWHVLRTYNPQDSELEYIGFKTIASIEESSDG